jgi:hypothetical protein
MEKPQLHICPTCKRQSLMLNDSSNRYECLNSECHASFFRATIDKYDQNVALDQKALDELSTKKTRSWFGNQYYDAKKKKMRDGKEPIRVHWTHNYWNWILIVIILLLISLAVTLILHHFYPNSWFFIFSW